MTSKGISTATTAKGFKLRFICAYDAAVVIMQRPKYGALKPLLRKSVRSRAGSAAVDNQPSNKMYNINSSGFEPAGNHEPVTSYSAK